MQRLPVQKALYWTISPFLQAPTTIMWYALCTPKKKEKEGLQKREMLTDALRVMVNNLFKKIFYEKRKKNN